MNATCSTPCCSLGSPATERCQSPAQCLDAPDCNGPIENAAGMWAKSFAEAMSQAQTDLLKTKILKSWGPMMDQSADAMIETMGALWAEKIAEVRVAEAKSAFQTRLRDLWLRDGKTKQ